MDEGSYRTAKKDSFSQNCGQVMNIGEYKQLHQQRLGYHSQEQEFWILDLALFAVKKEYHGLM
ncbi:hypothetical protein [Nitrosomonas sp. Nm34]|uniref:hypothetical protein n=1 Tax=Nitrosomonas sp. Nm34 TaxID=1881055 RepID=UPI0008F0DA29|nr:hypothetical protein [Nitrosomonas sp. Nm34]SFI93890.1 hypothetical protein SAMN05428978_10629 [Nitrosomonas sp. Nm34]